MAQLHRSEAARLHAELDRACHGVPYPDIVLSPLQRFALGGMPTAEGVAFFVGVEAGAPDQLGAALRCHRTWSMSHARVDTDGPLDLPGVHTLVRADESGLTIEITIDDPQLIPELQRRAAITLETARRYAATHH